MKPLSDVFIPKNYTKELPALRDKYFAWKMDFSSKTDLATTGHITHYEIHGPESRGNFVLVPGLASNTEIEPLMQAITYWSLKHKYNIYSLDTFLGDFQSDVSAVAAAKNTVPEFIDLMDAGLEIISRMSVGKWTCVVGHSLGGMGTIEVFNRRVQQKRSLGFSGAILFAPFVVRDWFDFVLQFIKHYQYPDLSDEEFIKKPVGIVSPHDMSITKQMRYISIWPGFYDDMDNIKPRPDLMAQYDMPVTIVAGGLDRKSPVEYMHSIYDEVRRYPNGDRMKFVEFPNSRHSFMEQYSDWQAILQLIKSQHIGSKKNKVK